ncbi:MFS transporter [Candidatus Woesearchaeota archaeon]|nr:MFS transporter [Candidatus Woesearchaeota archaeon]
MITKGYVKELWHLYVVEFLTSFYFARAIVILFFLSKGLSLAQIGFTGTVIYGTNMIFEYPSGIFADKYGRKLSIQIASIGAAIGSLVYALGPGFYSIIIASAIWGMSWSFFSGSKEAITYDSLYSIKKEKLNKDVIGFMDSIAFLGLIIATYVGHFLYQIDPKYPFLASAVVYSLAAFVFASYKEPKQHKSAETLDVKKAFKEGVALILKNKTLFYVFILSIVVFFFEHAWYETNQPLLLEAGLPNSLLSTYFVIGSILCMIGGVLLPKLVHSLKIRRSIIVVIVLQSVGLLFISTKAILFVAPFSYFLIISHLMWSYIDADIIHKHIPSKIRATAMSGRQSMISFVYLLNPWIMAYLVQTFRWVVFVYSAIAVFVIGIIVLFIGKEYLNNSDSH